MKHSIYICALASLALFGCATSRESIVASVNNVIGITVAQNQQTQMYEAKAGYVRTQFYLIPTDKIVENRPDTSLKTIQQGADKAPQVVSAVNMESGINQLVIGMKSKELFAVGSDAVNSQAAIAMFVGNAESTDQSAKAAAAVKQFGSASARTSTIPKDTTKSTTSTTTTTTATPAPTP